MKAAYLSSQHFTTHSFHLMLNEKFGKGNVTHVPLEVFKETDLTRFDLFVLPGIPGEDSPYSKIMTPEIVAKIADAVENHGLVLWSDCAATYEMMKTMEFLTSSGEMKYRNGIGLIDGVARGPVEGSAAASTPTDRFHHVVLRKIFYDTDQGRHTANICYGNGPGIFLSPEEMENPDVKILSRYGSDETSPAATVLKKYGKGLILSLGVLVQISPSHMQGTPPDKEAAQHRQNLFNELSRTDHLREHYLNFLMEIVHNHRASLGRQHSPTLKERHAQYT